MCGTRKAKHNHKIKTVTVYAVIVEMNTFWRKVFYRHKRDGNIRASVFCSVFPFTLQQQDFINTEKFICGGFAIPIKCLMMHCNKESFPSETEWTNYLNA